MKKLITTTTLFFVISLIVSPKAQAAACTFNNTSSVSVGSSCLINVDTVDGPDAGTGTTNTAILSISAGTLTLGGGSTLASGSFTLTGSAIILIGTNAQLKVGSPLYALDSDDDGYPSALIFYITSDTGRVRRNTLTSVTEVDCNDGASSGNNCCLAPEYC